MFGQNDGGQRNAAIRPSLQPETPQTFTLVAGEGDTDNAAFTIEGNELKLTAWSDKAL